MNLLEIENHVFPRVMLNTFVYNHSVHMGSQWALLVPTHGIIYDHKGALVYVNKIQPLHKDF